MSKYDEVVYAIYEAALVPENWPAALSKIGKLFHSEGAVVLFYSGNSQVDFIHCPEVDDAVRLYLEEEWWRHDIHAQRMLELQIESKNVFNDAALVTEQEMETLPMYKDFFRRVGFGWIMSAVVLPDFDMLVVLSVVRAKAGGSFSDREMKALDALSRHVEQSLRIHLRISNLETSQAALLGGLDRIEAGILALDADDRLVLANRAGKAQLSNYFQCQDGKIMAAAGSCRSRFTRFLDMSRIALMGNSSPRPCVIKGIDDERIAIWAIPVTDSAEHRIGVRGIADRLLLAIPLGSASDRKPVDPTLLRDVFELTLGEARLASLIGCGLSVSDAAETLGISVGTVRVVLKRVFEKLGVNRQAELALRVSNLSTVDLPASNSAGSD